MNRFHGSKGPLGFLSNFSEFPIHMNGFQWPTVEHYFQAMKFTEPSKQNKILLSKTAKDAKVLGNSLKGLRGDWDVKKLEIMRAAVRAKFVQHESLRNKLIQLNGNIVEISPNDYFWGIGEKETGKNMLGKILMEIRTELGGS